MSRRILCTGKRTADGWELTTGSHPLPPAAKAAAQGAQPTPQPDEVERYVNANVKRVETKGEKGK